MKSEVMVDLTLEPDRLIVLRRPRGVREFY